jgi:hypothetical protein
MPTHRRHPQLEKGREFPDKVDTIYYDDCDECARQAVQPVFHLDPDKMTRLWNRMLAVEFGNETYRSSNEAKACNNVWPVYIFLERFTDIDPKKVLPS